ncbi:MAG: STAS domain-containing protein [Acidimicrobiia bacterium]
MQGGYPYEDGFGSDRGFGYDRGFAIGVDGGARVVARGELDLSAVAELRAALDRAIQDGRVVVDLRLVTFMDSSAAGVLLDLLDEGTIPTLRDPSPMVARVLRLLGLDAYVLPAT